MTNTIEEAARVNTEFVLAITSRATEILRENKEERTALIEVLQMARDQFLDNETKRNHARRTYSWAT